jgi:hypothetical protein
MTGSKRDTVFLLLPSAFLLVIAALALSSANAFSFDRQIEQRHQQNFEEFVAKIQSGEVQPTKEKWIITLRDSKKIEADVEKAHATLSRILASGIFVGVLIQMYVIFRVKAGLRRAVS